MGKYLVADVVWEFNFPQVFNKDNYEAFQTDEKRCAFHTINFEYVDKIEKLKETNHEEFGLKMYVQDNVKLFDINDKHNRVVARGKYTDSVSTFLISKYEDLNLIDMLCFMRLVEVISTKSVIALTARSLKMENKAIIAIKDNASLFVDKWVEEIDPNAVFSNDKLFLKVEGNLVKVYGSPWSKSPNISNETLSLYSVIILSKGKENKFIEVTDDDKLIDLALHLGIMTDTLNNEALMQFCIDLLDRVNILKYKGKISIKEIFNKIYFS